MIAVIADDFTGAAEIGGIGLRHGLKVVIGTQTDDIRESDADLLIITTDSRSLSGVEAASIIEKTTKQLLTLNTIFIYKKLDSVLRGNIADELNAQIKVSGKKRAIIIAANPVFNRIIRNGIYYINGVPLHQTSFSGDPEYPVLSSSVKEIVGNDSIDKLSPDSILPEKGLIIGDVSNENDLEKWAGKIDQDTLPAGASGFFDALLEKYCVKSTGLHAVNPPAFGKKALYVLGSAFPKEDGLFEKIGRKGHYLSNMPEELYFGKDFQEHHLEKWVEDIIYGLKKQKKVVASVIHPVSDDPDAAFRIKEIIGMLVKKVLDRNDLHELIIEGGSTTSMVLKYLNINKLYPVQELETGVIRMRIENFPNLCLITKPGSYSWPENVWYLQDTPVKDSI